MSLRQQEQAFTTVNLYLRTITDKEEPYALILALLANIWVIKDTPTRAGETSWYDAIKSVFSNNSGFKDSLNRADLNSISRFLEPFKQKTITEKLEYWNSSDEYSERMLAWFLAPKNLKDIQTKINQFAEKGNRAAINQFAEKGNRAAINKYRSIELEMLSFNSNLKHISDRQVSAAEVVWDRLELNQRLMPDRFLYPVLV